MINTPLGLRVVVGPEAALLKKAFAELLGPIVLNPDEGEHASVGISAFDELTHTQKLLVLHNLADAMFVSTTPVPERTAVFDAAIAALFETLLLLVRWEIKLQTAGAERAIDPTRRQIIEAFFHLLRLQVENDRQASPQPISGDTPHAAIPEWVVDETLPTPDLDLDEEERLAREKIDGLFSLPERLDQQTDAVPSDEPQWSEDDLPRPDTTDESSWRFVLDCLCDGLLFDRDFELAQQVLDRDRDTSDGLAGLLGVTDGYFSTPAPDIRSTRQARELEKHLESLLSPWFPRNP